MTNGRSSWSRRIWRVSFGAHPAAAIGKRIREGMKDSLARDRRRGGRYPQRRRRSEGAHHRVLAGHDEELWGEETFIQRNAVFAIRSSRAGSESFINEIRQAVWSVNPDVPLDRHPHHGAGLSRIDGAKFLYAGDARHRRGHGAAARRHRHLRRHLLFGVAADTGDRDSHRARGPRSAR